MSKETWKPTTIGNCLESHFPGEWGSSPDRAKPTAKVVRATNLDANGLLHLESGAPRLISHSKLLAKQLQDGDLIMEASGGGPGTPVGRVAFFESDGEGPYLCSNFFRTLRPNATVHNKFLSWRLQHLYLQPAIWSFQQQTTGIINLKYHDYFAHEISLPPLPEQRRIAEILDTVDEAIRKTEEVIAKLEQMKQGLLHDLLTRGIDENGELRDPERHPEQFKDSPLGRIPREWEVGPFRKYVLEMRYGTSRSSGDDSSGMPVLRIPNVQRGYIDLADLQYQHPSASELARFGVRADDLLIIRTNGNPALLGRCAHIPDPSDWLFASYLIRTQVDATRVHPEFAAIYLNSFRGREYVERTTATSAGNYNINSTQLRAMTIAVPGMMEQQQILARLRQLEAKLDAERQFAAKLGTTKSGLMDDLLMGRVRIPAKDQEEAK